MSLIRWECCAIDDDGQRGAVFHVEQVPGRSAHGAAALAARTLDDQALHAEADLETLDLDGRVHVVEVRPVGNVAIPPVRFRVRCLLVREYQAWEV